MKGIANIHSRFTFSLFLFFFFLWKTHFLTRRKLCVYCRHPFVLWNCRVYFLLLLAICFCSHFFLIDKWCQPMGASLSSGASELWLGKASVLYVLYIQWLESFIKKKKNPRNDLYYNMLLGIKLFSLKARKKRLLWVVESILKTVIKPKMWVIHGMTFLFYSICVVVTSLSFYVVTKILYQVFYRLFLQPLPLGIGSQC